MQRELRDRLDEAVRMKLFGEVAQHLRESLDLEQARGMSDEKLVLLLTAELLDRLRGPSRRA